MSKTFSTRYKTDPMFRAKRNASVAAYKRKRRATDKEYSKWETLTRKLRRDKAKYKAARNKRYLFVSLACNIALLYIAMSMLSRIN